MYNMPVGVVIRNVISGSAADKAGAKVGDVITGLDGNTVSSYDELKNILSYTKAGETVEMVVKRANDGEYKEVKLSVTLSDQSALQSLQTENNSQQRRSGSSQNGNQ